MTKPLSPGTRPTKEAPAAVERQERGRQQKGSHMLPGGMTQTESREYTTTAHAQADEGERVVES